MLLLHTFVMACVQLEYYDFILGVIFAETTYIIVGKQQLDGLTVITYLKVSSKKLLYSRKWWLNTSVDLAVHDQCAKVYLPT